MSSEQERKRRKEEMKLGRKEVGGAGRSSTPVREQKEGCWSEEKAGRKEEGFRYFHIIPVVLFTLAYFLAKDPLLDAFAVAFISSLTSYKLP